MIVGRLGCIRQSTPTLALLMNIGAALKLLYHDGFEKAYPRSGGDISVPWPLPDIPVGQIAALTITVQG